MRPTASVAGHALLDEVLLTGFRVMHRDQAVLAPRVTEEVREAAELFDARGWLAAPETYHTTPPALAVDEVRDRRVRGVQHRFEVLSFESGYEPHAGEPGRDRWLAYEGNAVVRAWMLRHDEPRPWLVCVHGARMGTPNIDLTLFHAEWLHQELGLNVLLPVQPLHGRRRRQRAEGHDLPGGRSARQRPRRRPSGVGRTARAELDPLAGSRCAVGLTGVSLGGYVGSMVASLDGDLACAILGVPVVDLVALMEDHAGSEAAESVRPLLEPARRVAAVVSPLAMTPAIPHDRRFLYAGLADRVVHPTRQVMRLYEHWDRPAVHWYRGGHVLFFRAGVKPFVRDALVRSGLVAA